jgi:hypothetical protein
MEQVACAITDLMGELTFGAQYVSNRSKNLTTHIWRHVEIA